MSTRIQIKVIPEKKDDFIYHKKLVSIELGCNPDEIYSINLLKRSIDARKRAIKYVLSYEVFFESVNTSETLSQTSYSDVSKAKNTVYIVGCGPAGLFAALSCLQHGFKPVVFERGKDVRSRRRDIALLNKKGKVNVESNYCFGEGGAGTYSDGKLYTRSKKRGSVKKILNLLVKHGANNDITIDAHPHIGTNKLPTIIQDITQTIIHFGGEVNFDSKLTNINVVGNKLESIEINHSSFFSTDHLILATGHSARDVYELLKSKKIQTKFKPFAIGVRIEHKQTLIDKLQYNQNPRSEYLPPSSYGLVFNNGSRSVYSFCMCPGGIVAPCATDKDEVVTNGWSPSKRNNPHANSGIVVEVGWNDVKEFHAHDSFAGLMFQQKIEKKCAQLGGGNQVVPAQRLVDFMDNKQSESLPESSYKPGIKSVNLNKIFPEFIASTLKQGFRNFNQKLNGFLTNEAVLHACESRTSSPIRIPRNENFEHPDVLGLYPCGEGAGYAGGIVSAAIDGMKCVEAIHEKLVQQPLSD